MLRIGGASTVPEKQHFVAAPKSFNQQGADVSGAGNHLRAMQQFLFDCDRSFNRAAAPLIHHLSRASLPPDFSQARHFRQDRILQPSVHTLGMRIVSGHADIDKYPLLNQCEDTVV
jgi:hypothetical protein